MFIPKKPPALLLIAENGDQWGFDSLAQFVEHYGMRWIRASIGTHFRERGFIHEGYRLVPVWQEYPFVLRDDKGEPVTVKDCDELIEKRWRYREKFTRKYPFNGRGKTVPCICHYSAGGHYFRQIKTYPSRRAAAGVITSEGEPPFRAERAGLLPSNWDDFQVSSRRIRNWKHFRRTQYAPRNERGLRRRTKKMPQDDLRQD